METNKLKIYTALITPLDEHLKLDKDLFIKLLIKQDLSNIDGIVILSTTGEGSLLDDEIKYEVISLSFKYFHRDIILGINGDYHKIIGDINKFSEYNFKALLISPPPYLKLNNKQIYCFYNSILKQTKHKVILYNIPSRTSCNIDINVIKKLLKYNNLIGIKNASYDLIYVQKLLSLKSENFDIYSGNDELNYLYSSIFSGSISVIANLIPNYISYCVHNNYHKGFVKLIPYINILNKDINPIIIKEIICALNNKKAYFAKPLLNFKRINKITKKFLNEEAFKYECNFDR